MKDWIILAIAVSGVIVIALNLKQWIREWRG